MNRIASALLIAAAVLALNGGMLREAFADSWRPAPMAQQVRVEPAQPARNSRLLSLLLVLESLRQAELSVDGPKV
jgi:hypothetical protein